MGLLSEGSPLSWEETKRLANHVRKHGILQFINLYHKLKDRENDCLRWGDEVEYTLIKIDPEKKTARLSLRAPEILGILMENEKGNLSDIKSLWRPEYGSYMVEGTPGKPYGSLLAHFNMVEANMRERREEVTALLKPGELMLSIVSFPRLGVGIFTDPPFKPNPQDGASRSLFFPDEAIFLAHPRFKTLTRNIRERRKEKVVINIPIYLDINTPDPFVENMAQYHDDGEAAKAALPNHIYMDAMGFGMGCSCLQLTFQACNIKEARLLYDQLTPICPILLALSAANPIYRGYLSDVDCRWNIIAASVDCRTREERGLEPLKENKYHIHKSRYDSIDCYLSSENEKYNDIDVVQDKELYQQLREAGIDHLLAQHIAHLFIRDPISLFSEKIHQDNERDSDHFENLQSTNWQTMRFKPPPPNSTIGWRVEFRPTEVQLTDFENASYVVFVVLLTRVILSFQLNFVIPISKVDENMKNAQKRDAVRKGKFYFREDLMTCLSPPEAAKCVGKCSPSCEYTKMTINEIINGKEGTFPGLIPLIQNYLSSLDIDVDTRCTIENYLLLIEKRASGELMTMARWIREYVQKHPAYKNDSVISEELNYDLIMACDSIMQGTMICPELLGRKVSKSKPHVPAAVYKDMFGSSSDEAL